jgi:threonyl-tRNA synthetase
MRILTIHSDFIEVEPIQKAIRDAEEVKKEKKRYEELLVVFTAVEEGDEDVSSIAEKLTSEVENIANQVKTKRILLYPFVHLTSKPSAPRIAIKVLQKAEELLKKKGFDVSRAPFGWYKAFNIKCKGHPLSELSREIRTSIEEKKKIKQTEIEGVPESLRQENELKSRFCIMDVDGTLYDIDKFDYRGHENLKKFAIYETKKVRVYEKEPPHIKIMKEHSLIDYEPGSDPGNFRFYPKGRLIKKLLEKAITDYCIDYGAVEIETPLMYDFEHQALKKYLNRFPARQYVVLSDDKNLFLRFSACFGAFLLVHDITVTYKQLPFKFYELTRYSFRREQSGELAGLKRLRAFTMPDMHTLCRDMEQAKQEFERQFEKGLEWMNMIGIPTEVGFRVQEDFFNENKEWYLHMVKRCGKPILLEIFKERYAYFITKFEFNFIDNMDKASALTTVQIDVENAETYDINYIDEKGEKKRPLILHASLSGSLERVIYALLENEARKIAEGKKAMLPVWLSPTQLRILPISEKHVEYALKIAEKLAKTRIRVDCDDRDETLAKKIRDAEMEWIPYIAVIGDKEMQSGKLSVTIRSSGEKKEMTEEELIKTIEKENEGKPFEKLSLDIRLSKRPVFR